MTPKVLFGQLGGWQCHPLTENTEGGPVSFTDEETEDRQAE